MNRRGKFFIAVPGVLALAAAGFLTPFLRAQDDGQKIYTGKCAPCHGADGVGNTPAGKALKVLDFHSADVQKQSDADLAAAIANGKGKMQPYGKQLKDADIKNLVAIVRALGKK